VSVTAFSLPHASRSLTVTVRLPAPDTSVHGTGVARGCHALHVVPFDTHIWIGGLASDAVIPSDTDVVPVYDAPPAIVTAPRGAANSGAGRPLPALPLDAFPAASIAHAR
jgi:hypothetical protein